ncbi:MAG: hypothetical protein ACTSV2_08475 [Candidatus Thorarchaeota archaeon]
MWKSYQTKLTDFDDSKSQKGLMEKTPISYGKKVNPSNPTIERKRKRPNAALWRKITSDGEAWGVCDFDDTVLFSQIINSRIFIHGIEAFCKYCGGVLEIQENKVFCSGDCKVYQGRFSYDMNTYLHWEGAKSITLRKVIAGFERLELEERDLESIAYAPEWSSFDEYEEEGEYE